MSPIYCTHLSNVRIPLIPCIYAPHTLFTHLALVHTSSTETHCSCVSCCSQHLEYRVQPVKLEDVLDNVGKMKQDLLSRVLQVNMSLQLVKRCSINYEKASSNCAADGKKQSSPARMTAIKAAIYSLIILCNQSGM